MKGVKKEVADFIILIAAAISLALVLAFIVFEALGWAIDVPIFHLDGSFQTASGLFRTDAGQAPGRDFLPYLGIAPLFMLFPFFKLAGGTLVASVFSAKFLTLLLGWIGVAVLFHLIFKCKRVVFSLLGGGVVFTLIFFVTYPPTIAYVLSFGLEPGNSLKPLRASAPYLAAIATYFLLTRFASRLLRDVLAGLLVAVTLLWSNDFAIPTAGIFLAFYCVYFWFNERASWWRSTGTILGVALIAWALLLTVVTAGHPLKILEYNFIDVARDQWWYFGPYNEGSRVFKLSQLPRITSFGNQYQPLLVLGVLILAVVTRKLEHALLAAIGVVLFCGATLASVGGHLGDYYMSVYYWGGITVFLLVARALQLLLGLLLRKFSIRWEWLAMPACICLAIATVERGSAYEARLVATENNPGKFYVSEFGGYLGNEWKGYLEYARRHHGSRAVEDYWGIWSSLNRSFPQWPVDANIHALGGVREQAKAALPAADLRITTRYTFAGVWQPWNVSQNFWFYEDLLTNWAPDFMSPTTVVWRRIETPRQNTPVGCRISDDKKAFTLDSSDSGAYVVKASYSVAGSGRYLLMLQNNFSFAADSDGYVSLPLQDSTVSIPVMITEDSGSTFKSTIVGSDHVNFALASCVASKIAFENDELLHLDPGDEFFLTDANWEHGISRTEPAFFVRNKPAYIEQFQVGKFVSMADGDIRRIVKTMSNGNYLKIHVDGPLLDPQKVGLPNKFKVADQPNAPVQALPNSFYLSDGNWETGVARNWAGFFVPNTHYFTTYFRQGESVKFANGETRRITKVEVYGRYLNVYVDGKPLDPKSTGLPYRFSIVGS